MLHDIHNEVLVVRTAYGSVFVLEHIVKTIALIHQFVVNLLRKNVDKQFAAAACQRSYCKLYVALLALELNGISVLHQSVSRILEYHQLVSIGK